MEAYEVDLYSWLESVFQELYIKFRLSVDAQQLLQRMIEAIALAISLYLAGIAVVENRMTAGDFVLVASYVKQLFEPLAVR